MTHNNFLHRLFVLKTDKIYRLLLGETYRPEINDYQLEDTRNYTLNFEGEVMWH